VIEALTPYVHQVVQPAPVPASVRALKAKLHETVPTTSDKVWAGMPTPYKKTILRAASLDQLRECMPWKTFNRDEVASIRLALARLEALNAQLKGLLK
jgi:hypothetical protein